MHRSTLLAATFALTATLALAAEKPTKILLLDGGGTMTAAGPVKVENGLVIFRTPDGQLVSLSESRVLKIQDPPAPRKLTPTPTVQRTTGVGARGSVVRRPVTISNADLPPPLETTGSVQVPASLATPAPDPVPDPGLPAPAVGYAGHVDRNGNGEKWWRDRVAGLEGELDAVTEKVEELTKALGVAHARTLGGSQRPSSREAQKVAELHSVRDELEAAKARKVELQETIDNLPTEARQAGALPGWLR